MHDTAGTARYPCHYQVMGWYKAVLFCHKRLLKGKAGVLKPRRLVIVTTGDKSKGAVRDATNAVLSIPLLHPCNKIIVILIAGYRHVISELPQLLAVGRATSKRRRTKAGGGGATKALGVRQSGNFRPRLQKRIH